MYFLACYLASNEYFKRISLRLIKNGCSQSASNSCDTTLLYLQVEWFYEDFSFFFVWVKDFCRLRNRKQAKSLSFRARHRMSMKFPWGFASTSLKSTKLKGSFWRMKFVYATFNPIRFLLLQCPSMFHIFFIPPCLRPPTREFLFINILFEFESSLTCWASAAIVFCVGCILSCFWFFFLF